MTVLQACSVDADPALLGERPYTGGKLAVGGVGGAAASSGMGGAPRAGRPAVTAGSGAGRGGAGAGTAGRSGSGAAGRSGSGAAGRAGAGGRGGAGAPAAGSGGACRKNLACKLGPAATTGDVHQDCVSRINQFRTQCACLAPLERWTAGESCADKMAQHDSMTGDAHSAFTGRLCTPGGMAQNECPRFPSESAVLNTCLQQMWSEGPPPSMPCDDECFETYGHFMNMTDAMYKRVACGFYKTSAGAIWSVQNFSP